MTDHDLPSWQREVRSWSAIYRSAAAQCERVGADDPGESIRLEGQANARIAGLLRAAAAGDEAGARNAAEALAAFERAADGRHSRLYRAARELLLVALDRGSPVPPTIPT